LLAQKWAALSPRTVQAIPLASQRTCRIVGTGFDVKLPVNATLTGEHRILYPMNCENAPVISALATYFAGRDGSARIGFQTDLASIFHSEPALAPHLSAIFRAPVAARPGETVVPAINLWTGPCEGARLLRSANPGRIREFFERYCRALMA